MIYVFGNSHAHFFTGENPGLIGISVKKNNFFTSFSFGAVTAYNFYGHKYKEMLKCLSEMEIKPEDKILLVIGEVDCRWHLPKKAEETNTNINKVVIECVDRFFQTHLDLKNKGYNVIGWGGHPSTNQGHNDNMDCPIFGEVLYRNSISKAWSNYLMKLCMDNNIPFVSVVDDLIEINGKTKFKYFMDYCHLNTELYLEYVIQKFKQKGLC